MPAAGDELGAYRLVAEIGHGGMGAVWIAEHTRLKRRAAIKVLHTRLSHQPDLVARFFNEARAATAISDPGIVQIFDFGNHTDGTAYIAMELLDGESLASRLRRHGALSIASAIRLVRQVASSLAAAHAAGIVHRDLKPENIFIVRDPEVAGGERTKILDFGIAKLVDDPAPGVHTESATLLGTPIYMSPEQCRGAGSVDHRADLYSLGCVLFALVTGRPPFLAEGMGDVIAQQLREPPPRPSSIAPRVPASLDALLLKLLAKEPAKRFTDGTALAKELERIAADLPAETPPQLASGDTLVRTPPVKVDTTLSSSVAELPAAPADRRMRIAVGLGIPAIAVAIVAWVSWPSTDVATPASPPPKPPAAPTATPLPTAIDAAVALQTDDAPVIAAIRAFARWAPSHVDAACPSHGELGDLRDAAGRSLVITCTEQPDDQRIGVIAVGSDGKRGTADDTVSWHLPEAREIAGARWGQHTITRPSPPHSVDAGVPDALTEPASIERADAQVSDIPDHRR